MKMAILKTRLDQFVRQSFLPTDSADLRLKKVALTLVPLIIGPAAFVWGWIYCLLGHFLSGSIPMSYSIISAISLAHFFKTKETRFIQHSQLILVLLLPFLLMWSLGGFSAGSMVMIWAIFAPVAALMFLDKRSAMMWFLMYLALILVSVLIDDTLSEQVAPIPDWARQIFYLMNLGCGSAGLYMLLLFAFSEEKRLSEINLRIAASAFESHEGILVTNASNEILRVNRAFSAITGFSPEEVAGRDPAMLGSDRHGAEFFSAMWDAISKNGTWEGDIWNRRKNGDDFPAHLIITAIKDSDGAVTNYVGTFSDITERMQAEARLNDAHQRMASLLNSMAEGAYGVDLNGNCTFVNQSFLRILGYQSADEVVGRHMHALIHHSHADGSPYPARDCKMYKAYRQSRNVQVDDEVFWTKDGNPIPVEYWSQPIRSDNVVQGAVATFVDITERKRAEENLRITASVFDISQEAIFITDAENRIIDVNSAFSRITGYRSEEVIGRDPGMLGSGDQTREFYEAMWRELKTNKSWRGEIWNRRKSGEIYPEILSISVLCDAGGNVLRHVAVFSDISNLKEHEAELNRIAHFDALTGIPNRILLADRMKQAIAQTSREQNMMALCYLDLDGFKPINDTLGHQAGDEVLVEIARRIGDTIRGGDTSARLGGDEFVVLLLGLSKGEECVATLERLLESIAQPILVRDKPVTVSASIGVSIYPMDDEDPDTLLRHADQAMYIAKQSGKNRFHIYDVSLDRRARDQNEFLKSIRYALEHDQFELHYQPKINLRTRELVGVEGLIRWRHPDRGLLSPAEFMRYIENTGLDIEIGQWVTATALGQIDQWRKQGVDIEVSINISGYHLESPGFVEKLKDQLGCYPGMPSGKLQIEVLETVALNDINIVREIIDACHELGVGFALDDFGTGYSSLSYLSGFPVDVLKIDQSFVRDMLEDKGDRAIVQGIIALAQAFERQTVAEGIETDAQYQMLLDMGCELGQGFGIARPMPASEIAKWRTAGAKPGSEVHAGQPEG
jgi:diguanylate cyclase (GGDEF)-like protein/PAS domain S-box-containing protein